MKGSSASTTSRKLLLGPKQSSSFTSGSKLILLVSQVWNRAEMVLRLKDRRSTKSDTPQPENPGFVSYTNEAGEPTGSLTYRDP